MPDENTRQSINNISNQISNKSIRLVKPGNYHVTLEFIGNVSTSIQQQLISNAEYLQAKPFSIRFTQSSYWKKPSIICLRTDSIPKQLLKLAAEIKTVSRKLGLKTEERSYTPHITIARKVKQDITLSDPFCINWHANSFVLVESVSTEDGVEYRVLKEWKFN